MGLTDKIGNTADDLKGKGKEEVGKARGDKSQELEGKGDQVKADVKDAGENVKDAVKGDDK